MALALTIAGTNRVANLKAGTLVVRTTASGRQGVADFTLIDLTPADNATVVVADGATTYYSGNIRSRTTNEMKTGHWYCKVGCQNDATEITPIGAAPWAFSDTPNLTTTFPYYTLNIEQISARGDSYTTLESNGVVTTRKSGISPGHTLTITSANHGLSGATYYVTEVQVSFPTSTPLYSIKFGDEPITFTGTIASTTQGAVDAAAAALAISLQSPKVFATVADLPALPDATYPIGSLAFVTENGKVYRSVTGDEWTNVVDGADILVSSITAGAISAGAIGAQALAAEIIFANTLLATGTEGARVELDDDGIRNYDADERVTVNLPTDGSQATFTGEIEASSLTSTSSAELRGATSIPLASTIELLVEQPRPTAAPSLTRLSTEALTVGTFAFNSYYKGASYDSGAGTVWIAHWTENVSGGVNPAAYAINITTGAVSRTIDTGLAVTAEWVINGVAATPSYIFIGMRNNATSKAWLYKYNRTTLAYISATDVTSQLTTWSAWGLFWDTTNSRLCVITSTNAGSSSQVRLRRYNDTPTLQDTFNTTGYNLPDGASHWCLGGVVAETYYWIVTDNERVHPYNMSTGAYVGNHEFGTGDNVLGIAHDGTQFRGLASGTNGPSLTKFTNWDWTTESSKYWAAYSWYDSNATGSTHETEVGPRASVTAYRRGRLSVGNAAIPDEGGTDDPDSVRVYIGRGASDPNVSTYGNLDLQVTDSLTTRILTTYNSAGASDPSTNDFPSGTPAAIQSANAEWAWYGDGTASFEVNDNTSFTISSGGTATYSTKHIRYVKLGRLVFCQMQFTVTAAGSGAGTVNIATTGLPEPVATTRIMGDRGGVGVNPLAWRLDTGSSISQINPISDETSYLDSSAVLGSDLVNGATYTASGFYLSAS